MLPICRIIDVLTMSSSSSFCAATSLYYLLLPHTYSMFANYGGTFAGGSVRCVENVRATLERGTQSSHEPPGAQPGLLVAGNMLEITRQVGASVHVARLPRCLQGSKIGSQAGHPFRSEPPVRPVCELSSVAGVK
jgi:hypothetical protein